MTIRHLKIFSKVCEKGSITKAAKALYIAQPSVSVAIAELEKHYGIVLFDRINQRIVITEEGKVFLSYVSEILELINRLDTNVLELKKKKRIKIGATLTIGKCYLPNIIKKYNKLYPDVEFEVQVNRSSEIEQMIESNTLDFALIEGVPSSPNIIKKVFGEDKIVAVCSHNYSSSNAVELDSIQELNFLLREKGSGTREIFDSTLLSKHIQVTPKWESISTQALLSAAINNLGVAVLPYKLIENEIKKGLVKQINLGDIDFSRKLYIIEHKNKQLKDYVKDFIYFVLSYNKS